jgi:hypothetical protein
MRRAQLRLVALPGAAAFLVCCLVTRGGLLDHHRYGDVALYGHYAHEMTSGHWPYRDFFDEYPVLAQPLFFVVRLLPGPFATSFKWTMALCGAAALVLLVVAMRASLLRVVVAAGVAAISPLLVGPVFLNTYDLFPALLTIAAVLAFVNGWERTTFILLALAVAAKVFPLVLLPLVLIESWERGGRDAVRRALAAVLYVAWVYLHGRRDSLLAGAAAVTAFVAFNKVLSPQYVVWLIPLVPAAGIVASGLLVVVLALTRAEWNRFVTPHGSTQHWGDVLSWWILARDLVLVGVFALLVFKLWAGARSRNGH